VGMRQSTSDYILLLNDDTVVGKTILKDLIKAVQADPNIGIAARKYCITTLLTGSGAPAAR